MISNFSVADAESAEAFLRMLQGDRESATGTLPRAWRQLQERGTVRPLWYTRAAVLNLLSCHYALNNASRFLDVAKQYVQYSPARVASYAPEAWEFRADLAFGLASRDRDFLRMIEDAVIRSRERPDFIIPDAFCTRALTHLAGLRPDAAAAEVDDLSARCDQKRFDRLDVALFSPWCEAFRAVLNVDETALLDAVESMAQARRAFIDRELAGWKRGKLNVELGAATFLDIHTVSLLLIAEATGLKVYDADNPAFAFCDYQWIRSLWA